MKAIVLPQVGQPLQLQDVPTPTPGPGQALVQVQAAALNHRDVYIQQGKYPGIQTPVVLGSDVAGVVMAVGSPQHEHWLNQPVVADPGLHWGNNPAVQSFDYTILGMPTAGSFAEYVLVPAENLYPLPPHLSFAQAAALPLAGVTAWRALFSRAALQPHETLLVTGIGGGVAQFLLQFGLAHGAKVGVTSSSPQKLGKALAAGASAAALYTDPNWEEHIQNLLGGVDVAVDSAGGPGFGRILKIMAPGGRVAFFGGTQGKWPEILPQLLFWKQISILGSTMGNPQDFADMLQFVNEKKIIPQLENILPYTQASEAFQMMHEGKQFGKIVLTFAS